MFRVYKSPSTSAALIIFLVALSWIKQSYSSIMILQDKFLTSFEIEIRFNLKVGMKNTSVKNNVSEKMMVIAIEVLTWLPSGRLNHPCIFDTSLK